jgi:hypothetical protein
MSLFLRFVEMSSVQLSWDELPWRRKMQSLLAKTAKSIRTILVPAKTSFKTRKKTFLSEKILSSFVRLFLIQN